MGDLIEQMLITSVATPIDFSRDEFNGVQKRLANGEIGPADLRPTMVPLIVLRTILQIHGQKFADRLQRSSSWDAFCKHAKSVLLDV